LVLVVLLDVIIEQLLLEAKPLTALFDTLREIVNLKEEQNVILVDLLVILADVLDNLILD